jgi:hypothetical protein
MWGERELYCVMANVGFLEFSFNPVHTDREQVCARLNKLGFIHRNQHFKKSVGFWIQNSAIILLRETADVDQPKLSGIGLIVSKEIIDQLQPTLDTDCDLHVQHDGCGLRTILSTGQHISSLLESGYEVIDRKEYALPGLEYFSGMVYNCFDEKVLNFYQSLGFKITKTGESYITLVSVENRFSLLMNRHSNNGAVSTVICDTQDVFRTTSCYSVLNLPMRTFDIDRSKLDFGNKMNYKIVGYNCAAFGNAHSHTVENYVDNAWYKLDLIFRMRKQYLHITEQTLNYYAATRTQ